MGYCQITSFPTYLDAERSIGIEAAQKVFSRFHSGPYKRDALLFGGALKEVGRIGGPLKTGELRGNDPLEDDHRSTALELQNERNGDF